jgi:5-methylcytosine-specific restriction endonuclease McrA
VTCGQCGAPFEPKHFNAKLCSDACRKVARTATKAAFKGTAKGAACEQRWRKSPTKRATDGRYRTSAKGRAVAVARVTRQRKASPYHAARKRLTETAPYRKLRAELIATIGACEECGSTARLTLDHIVPMSKGGKHERSNVQLLCRSCNARKGNRLTAGPDRLAEAAS